MDQVTRRKQSLLLRLPATLREHATEAAHTEGTSLNYFIDIALAEKISRMEQAAAMHPAAQQDEHPQRRDLFLHKM